LIIDLSNIHEFNILRYILWIFSKKTTSVSGWHTLPCLCPRKKFQECRMKDFFLSITQKESIFCEFFLDVNFQNTSNANLLDVFIDNWMNQFWSPKGPFTSITQMIIIFSPFFVLMTSLDHSLVHVLNKQEKYMLCNYKDI